MTEVDWNDLRDSELRYGDRTWALTGAVEVRESGDLLAVEARTVEDGGGANDSGTLFFGIADPPASVNPRDADECMARLERTTDDHVLVVRNDGRTYRYELHRLAHQ